MICWGKLMLFTIFRRQENTQRNQTRTFVPFHVAWETVCSDGVVKILCNPYRNGFGGSVCTHSFAAQRANMQSWYVRVRRVALMINRGTHIAYKHTHTPHRKGSIVQYYACMSPVFKHTRVENVAPFVRRFDGLTTYMYICNTLYWYLVYPKPFGDLIAARFRRGFERLR